MGTGCGGYGSTWKAFKLTTVATPADTFMNISSGVMAQLCFLRQTRLVPDSSVARPRQARPGRLQLPL